MSKTFWEGIDAVCVINLDHRTDRWEKIQAYLTLHVPAGKIHRVSAVYGKELPGYREHPLFQNTTEDEARFWAGRAGCALSHRKCLQLMQDKGWGYMLILEDDAKMLADMEGCIGDAVLSVARERKDWHLFYLGMTPYYGRAAEIATCDSPQGQVKIGRVMGPLCTHCILACRNAAPDLLERLPEVENVWDWLAYHLSLDSWIANEYGKERKHVILGCYPNLCIQDDSYSDIEHHVIGHNQGALGGEPHPVEWVSEKAFARIFHSPKFLFKRYLKLFAHWVIAQFYYVVGYRKFHVSIESAGYWGSLKAAVSELRRRKPEGK